MTEVARLSTILGFVGGFGNVAGSVKIFFKIRF